jgi:DNA-binding NarL/FixJ family response regulator
MNSKGKGIRTILADDHPVLRVGFGALLLLNEKINLVAQAGNGEELVTAVNEHVPDLVVTDLEMQPMGGVEATRLIKAKYPGIKVIALSNYLEGELIDQALEAGADGYLVKNVTPEDMFKSIDSVMEGKTSFCPMSLEIFLKRKTKVKSLSETRVELSRKEIEVMCLIAKGKSSTEIADILCISIRTVEFHRQSLYAKIGVSNIAGITSYAIKHGYCSENSD